MKTLTFVDLFFFNISNYTKKIRTLGALNPSEYVYEINTYGR